MNAAAHHLHREIFDEHEAAEFVHMSVRTLRDWRPNKGLPFYRLGRAIRYRRRDLEQWLEENTVRPRMKRECV